MKLLVNNIDVTNLVVTATWSGSYKQTARKLQFTIATSPTDYYLRTVNISAGQQVKFSDQGKKLFSGFIFTKEKSYKGNEISITAYDGSIYLLKNKGAYNSKGMTAEALAQKICSDFGISVGQMAKTGVIQSKIFIGDTLNDIIMTAYSKAASQNGKAYIMLMINDKLCVIERGSFVIDHTLTNQKELSNSRYSESIEDMVNKVQIVNEIGSTNSSKVVDWSGLDG